MIKACIFDLDGTIADTVESIAVVGNRLLSHYGLKEQPVEGYNFFAGDGADELVRRILEASGGIDKVDYEEVRGLDGLKEAVIKAGDKEIKVAVVNGGANIRKLMDKVKKGETDYDFIECMACPGGCVNGGGQPIVNSQLINAGLSVSKERAKVLYNQDKNVRPTRKAHDNPAVKKMYEEFFYAFSSVIGAWGGKTDMISF